MPKVVFLWDERPGSNIDHIRSHGLTPDLWEAVFRHAEVCLPDKDDPSIFAAEGKVRGQRFRIVYGIDGETVIPLTIIPITGFPIARRGLRGNPS
jgi:hypothetical protein